MKNDLHIPEPTRLAEQSSDELGELLRAASDWEPPIGSQDRIWRRLAEPHPRLIDLATEDAAIREVLASAITLEPPVGAQERIWRQMEEEYAARNGLAEPQRLAESDAFLAGLLSEASRLEPAPGKRGRVYRGLQRPTRVRWLLPIGGLSATAAVLALVLFLRPDQPVSPLSAPASSLAMTLPGSSTLKVVKAPANTGDGFAVGDSLEVASTEAERFQVRGIGDVVLQDRGAALGLQQADDHGVHLALSQGRISIHAEKRTRQAPLVIHAQGAEVEVVGTIFSVATTSMGPRVFVKEGLVEVRSGGQVNRVGAGQTWPSTETMPGWATEAMNTLAGEQHAALVLPSLTVTAEPSVVAKKERTKIVKPSTSGQPVEEAKPTLSNPSSELPTLLPTEPIETPKPVVIVPPPPALPRVKASSTAVKSDTQNFDDSALDYAGWTVADLKGERAKFSGGSEKRRLISVLIALSTSPDKAISPDERRSARADLLRALEETGFLRNAVDVRKSIIRANGPEQREEDKVAARFANLATFVALNEVSEGLRLADLCTTQGSREQRAIAFIFKARLLANKGSLEAADSALNNAEVIDVNAPEQAASYFDEWAKRTPTHSGVLKKIADDLRTMGSTP